MSKGNSRDLFKVEKPCSQNWATMKGNDKVRFCEHCALEVNNLSAMRRKDAMRIVKKTEGRICVRYVKNPANNQPVFTDRLYQIAHRAPRLAVGAMTAALSLSSMAYAQSEPQLPNIMGDVVQVKRERKSEENKTENPAAVISGILKDPNGAVIPSIVVTLIGEKDASNKTATSNEEGFYEFKNVPAGNYTLEAVGSGGFLTSRIEGLVVSGGANLQSDIDMQVGGEVQTVGDIAIIEYKLPLLKAVSEGNVAEIKSLLANGADVNGRDENYGKTTALFVAVENGNIETVRTLLDFKAKINIRDEEKHSVLMSLDDDATPELVNLLLSYGAKINLADKEGNTALMYAAEYASNAVVQTLISAGAKVNAVNKKGETALMRAAENGELENVKSLLDAGADAQIKTKDGETALSMTSNEEVKQVLIAYGAGN